MIVSSWSYRLSVSSVCWAETRRKRPVTSSTEDKWMRTICSGNTLDRTPAYCALLCGWWGDAWLTLLSWVLVGGKAEMFKIYESPDVIWLQISPLEWQKSFNISAAVKCRGSFGFPVCLWQISWVKWGSGGAKEGVACVTSAWVGRVEFFALIKFG